VEVFGRPSDYNPSEDNIVRAEARELRKRLDIYFLTEGRGEPVRIRIPKGSYVPCFEPREDGRAIASAPPVPNHDSDAEGRIPGVRRKQPSQTALKTLLTILVGLLVGVPLPPISKYGGVTR
jgi:hypothetical protein